MHCTVHGCCNYLLFRRYLPLTHRRGDRRPTFLEYFQVFPQDVADEGRRSRLKGVLSHGAYVLPFHAKLVQRYPFEGEFFRRPLKPVSNVALRPLARIWNRNEYSWIRGDVIKADNIILGTKKRHHDHELCM